MKDTQYFAPTDVGEAVNLLTEYGDKVAILAGGTDLVPKINYYEAKPDALMYIGGLGLDYIKGDNGNLVIGAATPVAKMAADDLIVENASALVEAAKVFACTAIHTTATVGGNIVNASPAADFVPPLLVMDAELHLNGPDGERVVALNEFFTGPGETVLKSGEMVVEVSMPMPKGKTAFLKLGLRKALLIAVVNVAVRVEMDGDTCQEARIAMGSMAPTPLRCTEAEALLQGKALDEAVIMEAAAAAVGETSPIDDLRGTAWYRRKAGTTLVARALAQAAGIEISE